jgi:cyclohexanecarboxyl-CoA dehydrogenase
MIVSAQLSEDQHSILELAMRFARERLLPGYQAREKSGTNLDRALLREMGSLGLLAPDAPARYGGLGLDSFTSGLIAEAMGYGDFNVAYVPVSGSLIAQIIAAHARPELADRWIRRMVTGEALLAVALTEPRGGSDAANLVVQAARCDGGECESH